MDINNLLDSLFDDNTLDKLAKRENVDKQQVSKATQLALPTLLEQLGINAKDEKAAQSLAKALDDHRDDDISDISGFLDKLDGNDASKMLGHIFGDKKESVTQNISNKSGLDSNTIMNLLTMLAPLVMGYLGNQKKETKASPTSGGLGDLLGKVTKEYTSSKKTDNSIFGDILGGLFK